MSENVQLYMEPEEIKTRYLQAYDRKSQIGILADLNACSKREIEKVLEEQGVELPQPQKRREYRNWTAADDEELRDMAAAGFTATEIAQVLGRTRKAVAARRLRLGLSEPLAKKEDPSVVKEGPAITLEEERVIAVDQPSAGQGGEFVPAGQTSRDGASAGVRPVVEERSLADARNDMEDDARNDAVAAGVTQEAARLLMEAAPEQSIKTYVLKQLQTAPAAEAKAPAGRPVLSAEGMLRLVFRAVSTQLNSYMEDGDDKEPTLADLLSSVGLLALRYFDEGGKNND